MGINFAFINQIGIKVRAVAGYERWGTSISLMFGTWESSAWGLRNEYKLGLTNT